MATEAQHPGAFILSEGSGVISRDKITLAAGQNLAAGTVLGIVTASQLYAAYDAGATNGTEVAAGILYAPVDATSANTVGVAITRLAEVDSAALTGLDGAAETQLAALNIIVR